MKFTPGPWKVRKSHWEAVIQVGNYQHLMTIMHSHIPPFEEFEANIQLIAAAPAMLEALQAFAYAEGAWKSIVEHLNAQGLAAPAALAVAFETMREALKKAQGGVK